MPTTLPYGYNMMQQRQPSQQQQYNYQEPNYSTYNFLNQENYKNRQDYIYGYDTFKPNCYDSKTVQKSAKTKTRSKTWDKIKNFATSSKSDKNCHKYHHHNHQQDKKKSAYKIDDFRDRTYDNNYNNAYYCPPGRYHIHPKHSQVDLVKALYLRHDNQVFMPEHQTYYTKPYQNIHQSPIEYHHNKHRAPMRMIEQPSYNSSQENDQSKYSTKQKLALTQQETIKINENMNGRYKKQSNQSKSSNNNFKPRRSRSRKLKANISATDIEIKTSEQTSMHSPIYQTLKSSTASDTAQNIPPAPPIDLNLFKPIDTTLNISKKNKQQSNLSDQTEKSFNAVVDELKARLSSIKINSEKSTSEIDSRLLKSTVNSNKSLEDVINTSKTMLRHVSPIQYKPDIETKTKSALNISSSSDSVQSIYSNMVGKSSESIKSQQNGKSWLNSTSSSLKSNSYEENKASPFSYNSKTSSSSPSNCSLQTSSFKTNSIKRNTCNSDNQYKLEIYKEFDDISDDYTKYTRQMLSPQSKLDSVYGIHEHIKSQNQLANVPFTDSKKITAFCTRNLFRESKQLKSNFIKLTEDTYDVPVMNSIYGQNISDDSHSNSHGLLTFKNDAEDCSNDQASLNDYSTISKSFVQTSLVNKSQEDAVKSYHSNFKCKTSIPSKFSSFSAYNSNDTFAKSAGNLTLDSSPPLKQSYRPQSYSNLNEYSQICHSEEFSHEKNDEKLIMNKDQNKLINEYLTEMSNFYKFSQSNIQNRS